MAERTAETREGGELVVTRAVTTQRVTKFPNLQAAERQRDILIALIAQKQEELADVEAAITAAGEGK